MRELPLRCTIRLWDTYMVKPLKYQLSTNSVSFVCPRIFSMWYIRYALCLIILMKFTTFQSEPNGFSHFHLYVCAKFLTKWSKVIKTLTDFQVSWNFDKCVYITIRRTQAASPSCLLSTILQSDLYYPRLCYPRTSFIRGLWGQNLVRPTYIKYRLQSNLYYSHLYCPRFLRLKFSTPKYRG